MNKEIKESRIKLGLNQEEFAEKLGVTVVTVSKWENGKTIPTEAKMNLIKDLLKKNNTQTTTNGSNVNGDGNNVNHDSHDTYHYGNATEQMDGALCKFDKMQFSQIIALINELNKHCAVKDSQIEFCTEQITKLIKERDELQKQLMEIYRTGQINRKPDIDK